MKKIALIFFASLTLSTMVKAQFSYHDALRKVNDMVGLAAPHFEGTTIDGKKVNLASLKDKVIVINFWFVGCLPCEEEMPALNHLVNRYKKRDDIVFLSFAKTEEQKVKNFLEKNPFSYQTIADAKAIAEKYNVTGYPTQFIIDKDGKVQYTSIGGRADIDELLENKINKLLK